MENKVAMEEQFDQLGVWMDWDDPYMTLDPKYMESSWWTLKKANEKDLLVNDQRVISWSISLFGQQLHGHCLQTLQSVQILNLIMFMFQKMAKHIFWLKI